MASVVALVGDNDGVFCRGVPDVPCVKANVSTTQVQVSYGYALQNCTVSPLPPDATGLKSKFALQLARRGP
jgi:hypothetical protein